MIIKHICILSLIVIFVSKGNTQNIDEDPIKKYILWTVTMDRHLGDPKQIKEILSYIDTGYYSFKYEKSELVWLYPGLYTQEPPLYYPYFATVFKIVNDWGLPYYLMKVEYNSLNYSNNKPSSFWIRVAGFKECDLKVFFDVLMLNYPVTKKKLISFFKSIDEPLLKELDWDCIFQGYFDGNNECDAYISNTYSIRQLEWYELSGKGYYSDKIYSTFSNFPWSGVVR